MARRSSSFAMGGRMLNPSVEPTARRESFQAMRDDENKERRASSGVTSPRNDHDAEGRRSSNSSNGVSLRDGADLAPSDAAVEARKQRRSTGLKRFSINDHITKNIASAMEDAARDVGMADETSGIEKLQNIMTEAKEKGIGVSKMFHFFLMPIDPNEKRRESKVIERKASGSAEKPASAPAENAEAADSTESEEAGQKNVLKETLSSKTKADASKPTRKYKPLEMMPSLQKGNRPSTGTSKRRSAPTDAHPRMSHGSSRAEKETEDEKKAAPAAAPAAPPRKRLSRRSSSLSTEDLIERLITFESFQRGLATLGFGMTDQEAADMFKHLGADVDNKINLHGFTRFCIEIPSMAWKAERARRGIFSGHPGAEVSRELDKAAQDIANEAIIVGEGGDGGLSAAEEAAEAERRIPRVNLGKVVFRGEKFFWRTKDLIEVVIQLNATQGFMAVHTFHTGTLEVYPMIFVDPSKIPINEAAIVERTKDFADKELESKRVFQMEVARGDSIHGTGNIQEGAPSGQEGGEAQTLAEKAHMGYIADYLMERVSMPDENGNLLQSDLTQPGVEVNPDLPSGSTRQSRDGSVEPLQPGEASSRAKPRPGLKKSTLDEWDTLLFLNPPSRVEGAPVFSKTKKRESYFNEFLNKTGEFDDNRVKAHRLSTEAASYSEEVSRLMTKLAPLNYSASAPIILKEEVSGDALPGSEPNPRRGSGRIVLADNISQASSSPFMNGSRRKDSLLESQSVPVLPTQAEVAS